MRGVETRRGSERSRVDRPGKLREKKEEEKRKRKKERWISRGVQTYKEKERWTDRGYLISY